MGKALRYALVLVACVVIALPGDADAQRKPRAGTAPVAEGADPHAKVMEDDKYPSASKCKSCHAQIYDEWRSSNHAYAGISPMFHKFEQKINDLSQGTIGTFCLRCHASVGTTVNERRELPLWDRSPVSREGVTCVTCHRVREEYGRVNG